MTDRSPDTSDSLDSPGSPDSPHTPTAPDPPGAVAPDAPKGAEPDDAEAPSRDFDRALQDFEAGARPILRIDAAPLQVGAKVKGTVVGITPDQVLIDIGARSEAGADAALFRNEDGTMRVAQGDVLELFVVEADDAIVLAPSVRTKKGASAKGASLDRMREARAAGMPVTGKVTAVNTGGLEVDLAGVRGFCPVSQIELTFCAEPGAYVGRSLEFLVTRLEEERRSVVLSRRELLRREEKDQAKVRLATMKVGDEVQGRVRRLEAFGAFLDIGGVDAMVHVSEIGHARVAHPRDVLREGETVRAQVLRIETGKDGRPRIAVSIKSLRPDPWSGVELRYTIGARVRGTVARLTEFGAFVTLEPGIDGLVHVSEIAPQRIERARDVLTQGQEIEAVVLAVDPAKKRISLSIKRAAEGYVEEAPRSPRSEAGGAREPGAGREPTGGRDPAGRRESVAGREPGGPRLPGAQREPGSRRDGPGRDAGGRREGGGPREGGGRREAGGRRESAGRRESGPRRESGGRREPMGEQRRESRGEREPTTWSTPKSPDEPTTMAIALRKAMEKARKQPPEE